MKSSILERMPVLLPLAPMAQAEMVGTGAGWVGAGLLGSVLFWLLMRHLPDKDRQIKELLADKDKQIMDLISQHNEERSAVFKEKSNEQQARILAAEVAQKGVESLVASFSVELKAERETCERRHSELLEKLDERHKELLASLAARHKELLDRFALTHEEVRNTKHEVLTIAQDRANARALEKMVREQQSATGRHNKKEPQP